MSHLPTLKTLMTPFPYAVNIEASLTDAQAMMTEHAIRHLPVTESSQLVGVLTDRDLHCSLLVIGSDSAPDDRRVRDVCVGQAYVVELTEPLDTVLLQMATRHIDSALVVRHGKLVGIFTAVDACQGFGDYLRAQLPTKPEDEVA